MSARGGGPVHGARVSLYHGDDALAEGAPTDAGGLFSRDSLAPGAYQLSVAAEGFAERTTYVNLDGASTGPVLFALEPKDAGPTPTSTPTPTPSPTPSPSPSPSASPEASPSTSTSEAAETQQQQPTPATTSEGGGGQIRRLLPAVLLEDSNLKWWLPGALLVLALCVAAYLILGGGAAATSAVSGSAAAPAAEAAAAGTTKQSDKVFCTLYGPKSSTPGSKFITQVFAHLKEQEGELDALAQKGVGKTAERFVSSKRMGREIERDAEIFFRLVMEGLEVKAPEQTIFWDGVIDSVTFEVKVPEGFAPGEVPSDVIFGVVNDQGVRDIIGHVNFTFQVADASEPAAESERPPQTCVLHERAFISYASEDREEVLKRVQGIKARGTECFMDKLTFKTGEEWEAAISRFIEQSDVFYLFWSRRASESEWIQKEIDLALEEQRETKVRPLILPMPLEDTSVVAPPAKLSHMHFDDPILDNIDAQRYRRSQQQTQQS